MADKIRILVVDDESTVLMATTKTLISAGYEVIEAMSGEEGLRLARAEKPDLILLDVVLPGIDGLEVCRRIKADDTLRRILIVMLTAFRSSSDQQVEGLDIGADEYIVRPIDSRELLARVRAMVRIKRAEDRLQRSNEELEQRVQERVAEFIEVNKKLQAEIALRAQAEESLRKERSLLLTLIETMPDEVCLKDLDSRYLMANPACVRALGARSLEELIGKSDRDYVRADLAEGHRAEEQIVLETGMPLINQERTKYDPVTGEILSSLLSTKVPVMDFSGKTTGLLVINRYITEHRRAEEALRESEERFHSVWESSADGMRLTDNMGRIIDVNNAYCQLVKLSREELVGEIFSKTYRGQAVGEDIEVYRTRYATGQLVPRVSLTLNLWNDENVDVEILHSFVVLRENRKMVLSIFRNVMERNRAERRLQQERNLLRTIIDAIPDEIVVKDTERRFVLTNPSAERALGRSSREEILGRRDEDLIPEEFARRAKEEEESVLTTGRPSINNTGLSKIDPKTGQILRSILTSKIPLLDRSGEISGLVAINRDITELKRAEIALRESEELYRALIDTSPDAITMTDLQGKVILCSNQTAQLHGYESPEALFGMNVFDRIVPEHREKALMNLRKTLETGSVREIEYDIIRKDGSRFPAEISAALLRDATGNPKAFIGISRDITERKHMEAEQVYQTRLHRFRSETLLLFNRQDSIEEILQKGVEIILGYFDVACAQIWTLNSGFELKAHAGSTEMCATSAKCTIVGRAIANEAKTENKAILKNSLAGDALVGDTSWARQCGIVACAALPLFVESRMVGVLVVFSKVPLLEPTLSPLTGATFTIAQGIVRREAEQELRASQEQLRALASHLQVIREEERTHIARELHDELGQTLTAIKMDHSSLARDLLEGGGTSVIPFVERISLMSKIIDQTVAKVQDIALELRPDVLDDLGLLEAVEWYSEEFQRRSAIRCHLHLPEKRFAVDDKMSTSLFRVLQEALTNVARHSGATTVDVTLLRTHEEIALIVRDNGRGIGEVKRESRESLGILGMSERVSSFGGALEIIGVPGEGTMVSVKIPLQKRTVKEEHAERPKRDTHPHRR